MSNEVVVPEVVRDNALTATQRYEIIMRANGNPSYVAPRQTGESTTRQAMTPAMRQFEEHSAYLDRCKDSKGFVTAEQYVAGGDNFTFGYQLPAGTRVAVLQTYVMLGTAKKVGMPSDKVFAFMLEYSKNFA